MHVLKGPKIYKVVKYRELEALRRGVCRTFQTILKILAFVKLTLTVA